MPARAELATAAAALNIDSTLAKYQNDSVLEQAVRYAQANLVGAAGTATTLTPPASEKAKISGGKNV
jgi:hypothetical protein